MRRVTFNADQETYNRLQVYVKQTHEKNLAMCLRYILKEYLDRKGVRLPPLSRQEQEDAADMAALDARRKLSRT